MTLKKSIFIELTISDNCNCNCKYCFEGKHPFKKPNLTVLQRQIELIQLVCKDFNKDKYEWLTISFWGGEPFMDLNFINQLILATYKYDFVRYHCYSNGTLVDQYKLFLELDYIESIHNRLHIQLSYDGEPHHTIKRGDNSSKIFEVADLLNTKQIEFTFKATLSYDMIECLPLIWDSYEQLFKKYGKIVKYYPTLDTCNTSKLYLDTWKNALLEVAKKEYQFFKKHGRYLFGWFDAENRRINCALGNSIHIHTDGNIYICHGCAYKESNDNFKIGSIFNITSLYDIISERLNVPEIPIECKKCASTHCQVCHIENIRANLNPYDEWIKCRVNNIERCKFFKEFGYMSKLLKLALVKEGFVYGYTV